jgi:hypothetical protein
LQFAKEETDPKNRFYWLALAEAKGNQEARYLVAKCYLKGNGVEKDASRALEVFNACTDAKAFRRKGMLLQEEKHTAIAYKALKEAALRGDKRACYELYEFLTRPKVSILDVDVTTMAIYYLQKAAELGHAPALAQLAWLYRSGDQVCNFRFVKNAAWSVYYYQKAADLGYKRAIFRIGEAHYEGWHFTKNEALGIEFMEKAATLKDGLALLELGKIYRAQKIARAPLYLQQAAEDDGDVSTRHQAMFELGKCYMEGACGLVKDVALALEWFQKAHALGSESAKFALREHYARLATEYTAKANELK